MSAHVRVSGTHREVEEAFVRVSGTHQRIKEWYVRVAGTHELVYAQGEAAMTVGVEGKVDFVGYNDANPTGSLDDDEFYRQTLCKTFGIYISGGNGTLTIEFDGTLAQDFFGHAILLGTGESVYNSASADDFTQAGGTTTWEWELGTTNPEIDGAELEVVALRY